MTVTNVSDARDTRNSAQSPCIPARLIDGISEHLADRHSSLTENERLIIAVWIIHTYFYVACGLTVYLHIASLGPDAGKSEIALALNDLCYVPFLDSPTVAALSTFKASGRHTLIMDEMHLLLSDKRGSIVKDFERLINMGHKPGFNWTVSGDKPGDRDERDPFFPKAFIGIGPDILNEPMARRCIRIMVRPGTEAEQTARERNQAMRPVAKTAANLRNQLTKLAATKTVSERISADMLALPVRTRTLNDGKRLINGDGDIWRVMFTIADMIGPDYGKRMRDIAAGLAGSEPDYVPTLTGQYDAGLQALMRTKRLPVTNWAMPGKSPLPGGCVNLGMTSEDFGWPSNERMVIRDKLASCSLVCNTDVMRAELRFKASDFASVCAALPGSPNATAVKQAYQQADGWAPDVSRLHAVKDRTNLRAPFLSGQGDTTVIAIDITCWIWPDMGEVN
jgi:hypothetical protein